MAVRIDIWLPTFTGTRNVVAYTITSGSQHDIIAEQLPVLTSEIEQNLSEFTTGDVVLSARNDDGWWDSTAFTSARLDPTARFPLCLYVDIYRSDALVFQGDVDLKTISFDRKLKTVSFTVLGPLHRLEQWSAETVRRATPDFCDTGIATSTGTTGSNWYLVDTTKTWYATDVANCCLIDSLGTIWTILGTYGMGTGLGRDGLTITNPICAPPNWGHTPTTPPPVASYIIRPYAFVSRYDWQSPYGTLSHTATSLTDSGAVPPWAGKAWTTNQWAGYFLYDSIGVSWAITANSATVLTVTAQAAYPNGPDITPQGENGHGTYSIRKSNYPNLLESLGPAISVLGFLGQSAIANGDTLNLTAASGISPLQLAGFRHIGASTQANIIQWAGAKASNPTLTDHQLWMTDKLEQEISELDGVMMATPYHRDKTVAQLAALLFLACGSAAQTYAINVPAYTDDVVRYADFGGKSVADALTELALISNCTLFCKFSGTTSVADAPRVTYNFQRRDAGLGNFIDLSAADALIERKDTVATEWYYPSIVVEGANQTKVQQGSARPGASQLSVQSDFMDSYTWLHQVLDRLWDFYGLRRAAATVKAKAELVPAGSAGYAPITDTFEADTIGSMPTGWSSWRGEGALFTVQQPSVGGNTTKLLRDTHSGGGGTSNAIKWDTPGTVDDIDLSFDLWFDNYEPWSVDQIIRFWPRATDTANPYGLNIGICGTTGTGYPMMYIEERAAGGVVTGLAVDPRLSLYSGIWYRVRVVTSSHIVQAKIWPLGTAEPGAWNVTTNAATVLSGFVAIDSFSSQDSPLMYMDNFAIAGHQGTAAAGLLSKVALSATDEWWIVGMSRPLREPADVVELDLISATGTPYIPDDDATIDASALPEPPTVTGTHTSGSNRHIEFSWPFGFTSLLGFQRRIWLASAARPSGPSSFSAIGGTLSVVAGSPPTFHDVALSQFLPSSGPWYVDYQAVLIDGRVSNAGLAYYFA